MLIDSHCHIHDTKFYPESREEVYKRAIEDGVQMIVVGTSEADSLAAVDFAVAHDEVWAVAGVHPHEVKDGWQEVEQLVGRHAGEQKKKLIAVGEIGLDYHYSHSPRDVQVKALESQIDLALRHDLPIVFHVRDAYDDFWPVLDNFRGVRGVLHSFTDTQVHLEEGLKRNLFVSVNGISTFTKDPAQQKLFRNIPLDRLLLETDAPFLTPSPFRGRVNEPVFVREVAKHQAEVRGLSPATVISASTANAKALFAL